MPGLGEASAGVTWLIADAAAASAAEAIDFAFFASLSSSSSLPSARSIDTIVPSRLATKSPPDRIKSSTFDAGWFFT